MKFAVIAPVAAGVTADPAWMSAFARHVETCGFESIVVVEHTVLMTEYSSVYPRRLGTGGLSSNCPVPDPLISSRLWLRASGWAWPPACWCCPITILWFSPSGWRPWMRCRAASSALRGNGVAEGGDRGVRRGLRQPRTPRRRATRGDAAAMGGPAETARAIRANSSNSTTPLLSQARTAGTDPYRRAQPPSGPSSWPVGRWLSAAWRRRCRAVRTDRHHA